MPSSSACSDIKPSDRTSTAVVSPARLVIFDSKVNDLPVLLNGLQTGVQGHVLNPDHDGIAQISTLLQQTPADEISLVAHGFSGGLQLGANALMLSNLAEYEPQLRRWFVGRSTPRLALLAGKVAQGQLGREFISRLTTITGAQVRASTSILGQGHWLTATAQTFKPRVLNTYRATL